MATTNPLQAALQAAVDDGAFPGAVLAVRLRGTLIYEGAVGRLSPQIPGEGVTIHTCYDLASLTKVLATTTALLLLMQRGKLTLDDRIDRILIALQGSAAGAASIHQLLTHSSGLPGWRPYYERLASLEAGQAGFPGRTAAREACRGAHLVTTDVWTSMGYEAENEARLKAFADWCVDTNMMALAQPDALFMHCLPAHRGEEVAAEVIDGPQSVVWDEAENRMHVQKALMEYLLLGRIG